MIGYEGLVCNLYNGSINYDEFVLGISELEGMNTDWFNLICEDVFSHQHTISLSGGSEEIRYYSHPSGTLLTMT